MSARSLSRDERLRRVLILCCSFARNLAYYRTGRRTPYLHLQQTPNPTFTFWRAVSGNFIDMCVLEWCKLFADRRGKHYWRNIAADPDDFRVKLLNHLGIDEVGFQKDIDIMLRYRDKFIAHLDSDIIMNIPALDAAKKAVWFYHGYVLAHENIVLAGLPADLDKGYMETEDEAATVYRKAGGPDRP
jgi:hypothetical protein